MSRLIIISGDLAAGKSTLANSLSNIYNISAFKKDELKERYCDKYGYTNREENRELSRKAFAYMLEALNNFASQNMDIILEANFREEELSLFKDVSDKYHLDVTLLVLRGDLNVLYKRFLDRLPNRHIAHKSLHLDESFERFSEYVLSQRDIEYPFIPHFIDVVKNNQEEVLKITREIIF